MAGAARSRNQHVPQSSNKRRQQDMYPKQPNSIKYFLCALMFMTSITENFIAPFLPPALQNEGINEFWIGMIFASFPIFQMISSPVVPYCLQYVSHKNMMCSGLVIVAVSLGLLGSIATVIMPSGSIPTAGIITLFIAARGLNGIAIGMEDTALFAFAALAYPDENEEVVSLIEAAWGLGEILGPLLGFLIYDFVGLSIYFYVSLVLLPLAILILFVIPKPSNAIQPESDGLEVSLMQNDDQEKPKIAYKILLLNSRIVFGVVCYFLHFFIWGTITPILALQLTDGYGLKEKQVGLVYSLTGFTYIIGTLLTPYITASGFERGKTLLFDLVLLSIALLITAPAYYEVNLAVTCVGLGLLSLFLGPNIVLPPPEMIDSAKQSFKDYNMDYTTDMLSGMLSTTAGLGEASGPILGVTLAMKFGFQISLIIIASIVALVAFLSIITSKYCRCKYDPVPESECDDETAITSQSSI